MIPATTLHSPALTLGPAVVRPNHRPAAAERLVAGLHRQKAVASKEKHLAKRLQAAKAEEEAASKRQAALQREQDQLSRAREQLARDQEQAACDAVRRPRSDRSRGSRGAAQRTCLCAELDPPSSAVALVRFMFSEDERVHGRCGCTNGWRERVRHPAVPAGTIAVAKRQLRNC